MPVEEENLIGFRIIIRGLFGNGFKRRISNSYNKLLLGLLRGSEHSTN
jgi:hypothetical protein